MTRYATIIGLKPEAEAKYKKLHAAVWPGVLETIKTCNISNYSIYLYDHKLFAYFEYLGSDYAADMAKMAADKTTQEWWVITDAMQIPLPGHKEGQMWTRMEEVFHVD